MQPTCREEVKVVHDDCMNSPWFTSPSLLCFILCPRLIIQTILSCSFNVLVLRFFPGSFFTAHGFWRFADQWKAKDSEANGRRWGRRTHRRCPGGPGIEETRWKPRTRMYSRSWTTSENLCNRKTKLFFHASCAHIVSAKAPQLTHKDTHGKHRLKIVHISPVTSLQCGVESVECGVWSGKCRVCSVECKATSVECTVWSGECRVCKVWNV